MRTLVNYKINVSLSLLLLYSFQSLMTDIFVETILG